MDFAPAHAFPRGPARGDPRLMDSALGAGGVLAAARRPEAGRRAAGAGAGATDGGGAAAAGSSAAAADLDRVLGGGLGRPQTLSRRPTAPSFAAPRARRDETARVEPSTAAARRGAASPGPGAAYRVPCYVGARQIHSAGVRNAPSASFGGGPPDRFSGRAPPARRARRAEAPGDGPGPGDYWV